MITSITVPISQDVMFRKYCDEIKLSYTCIEEGEDTNCYQVKFKAGFELYYLGMKMGVHVMATQ